MASQLTSLSISAPGFFGLNRQDASIDLPVGFAQIADNCVIDKYGRLGSRKGWTKANTTSAELSTANITALGELITTTGVSYILCAGNNKIFKLASGALTELTYGGGGTPPTITASNWQIVTLNGIAYLFQSGYDALIFDPTVSATTYRRVTEKSGYVATVPLANTAISAFGRIWCADTTTNKVTIAWSDLSSGFIWSTGTAGTLDLTTVWVNGADEIITLAAHNNFLVIFGRRQILIYAGANNPSTMALSDTVSGIGCIGRDTVQNTGTDLIFLSQTGVRSLMRTIQEKSSPLRDISKNIRDHLISDATGETEANFKSIYSDINAFYLLTIPTSSETYCFDTRAPLEDGSFRVTTWSLVPKSFCVTKSKKLYMGMAGYIGEHTGYLDDASTYIMTWYSTHMKLGEPNHEAILKKIDTVTVGGNGQIINLYYAYDFSTAYQTNNIIIPNNASAHYGVAHYNYAHYAMVTNTINLGANIGGAGKIVQIGISAEINGFQLSFQKIDIFAKVGKLVM